MCWLAASSWQRLQVGGGGGGGGGGEAKGVGRGGAPQSCKGLSLQALPVCTIEGHLLPVDSETANEGASMVGGPAPAPDRQQRLEVVPAAQLVRLRMLAEAMLRSGDHTCFKVSCLQLAMCTAGTTPAHAGSGHVAQ